MFDPSEASRDCTYAAYYMQHLHVVGDALTNWTALSCLEMTNSIKIFLSHFKTLEVIQRRKAPEMKKFWILDIMSAKSI